MDHAAASAETLHVLGCFDDPFAGAELGRLSLAQALAPHRPVQVWSCVSPHGVFRDRGVRVLNPAIGEFPRGGQLLLTGVHVVLGPWLQQAGLSRVTLHYNLPDHRRLFERMAQIRLAAGLEPELVFVSPALQNSVGLPGRTEPSLIDLDPFLAIPIQRPARVPTVGRHSRDVIDKHHPDDPALYRQLAASGWRVRLMGGTCLAEALRDAPGVECLPSGAEPVADFLASLDVFFYRTTMVEAYGRVVFEALGSGLASVLHVRGGYASLLNHGHDTCLFQTQEQALAALHALRDAAPRHQMGSAGRETALRLHGRASTQAILNHYLA